MLLFGCWSGLVLNFGCHEFWAGLHQASPLHQEDQQGFSKTIPWLIEGRKEEVYICSLPGGKKPTNQRERSDYIYSFSPQTKHTKLSHTCSKCITWVCFHIEIDWDDLAWDGGFMQNQIYYCICVYYFRWRQKSLKSKSSISILHLENHFEANFLLIIMLSIH